MLLFKLEGQVILRNPDYKMEDKLAASQSGCEHVRRWKLTERNMRLKKETFPTVNFAAENVEDVYQLTEEEEQVMEGLQMAFVNSIRLRQHIDFLYKKGSMYRIFNDNFLYHGCVPLDESGNFEGVVFGKRSVIAEEIIWIMQNTLPEGHGQKMRRKKTETLCGICGAEENHRCQAEISKTFERTYVQDETTWYEESNPYYRFYEEEKVCNMILHEFGLYSERVAYHQWAHTGAELQKAEHPVRANGKLMVIDGGFLQELP